MIRAQEWKIKPGAALKNGAARALARSCKLGRMSSMSSLRIAGVIPARLASTRLSRKVLRLIAGRPMVEWVWRAAHAAFRWR